MKTVVEPARNVPVVREVDVLVVGGGYAGFGAAMTAAREGADTLLVEQQSCLGGLVTLGLVALTFSYIEGIGLELFKQLKAEGALAGRFVDPEKTKRVMEQMLLREGAHILYATTVVDSIVEDGKITGVIVHSKSGRQAILARRVVDASGDGDVAAYAGVPFEVGDPDHEGYNQSASLVCRVGNVDLDRYTAYGKSVPGMTLQQLFQDKVEEALEAGDFPYMVDKRLNWAVYVPGRDRAHAEVCLCYAHSRNCRCLDNADLTRMYIEQRQQNRWFMDFLRKYIPGYENAWLIDTAPMMGVRDSRRIMGEYKMTGDDLVDGRLFDDAIVRDMHTFDVHHPTEPGHIKHILRPRADGSPEKCYVMPGSYREVPYRAIVPLGVDNLLIAGRNLSSDFMAQSGLRLVLFCLNLGQAAGVAAAMSLRDGVTPRRLDAGKLRARLIAMGFLLDKKPAYGTENVSTDASIGQGDIIIPDDSKYGRAAARPLVANDRLQVGTDIDSEMERRKKYTGYTETGGDVGTNLE